MTTEREINRNGWWKDEKGVPVECNTEGCHVTMFEGKDGVNAGLYGIGEIRGKKRYLCRRCWLNQTSEVKTVTAADAYASFYGAK